VHHFAGDVVYFAHEFLEKNNDSLDPHVEAALLASEIAMVGTQHAPPNLRASPRPNPSPNVPAKP